jgi:hypothetical protein
MKVNMKKLLSVFAVLYMLIAALPFVCFADEPKQEAKQEQKQEGDKVTGGLDLSVLSAYIWRGQELSRHSIVVQPSATLSYKGFTANVWGNLDTRPYSAGDAGYAGNFTETDITLSYSRKFGIVQAGAGYIYYALSAPYSGAPDPLDSQEVFVTVGLDTILQPTFTAYKEIDHYHQWYFLLGVSHLFEFNKIVSLKLAASASYLLSTDETTYAKYDGNALATTDKYNNFHDGTVSVSLPLAVYKSLTITPTVSYVFPLSNDARYEMKGRGLQGAASPSDRDSAFLYGGITMSFAF